LRDGKIQRILVENKPANGSGERPRRKARGKERKLSGRKGGRRPEARKKKIRGEGGGSNPTDPKRNRKRESKQIREEPSENKEKLTPSAGFGMKPFERGDFPQRKDLVEGGGLI